VAAGAIFRLLLNTRMGLVNKIIVALGGQEINFLGSEEVALVSCVILAVWLGFGGNMIIFLAGLQDIPKSYYEAAQIDGARPWQQFVYITFPGLARTSIFVLTMSFINSFQMYDLVKMLTGGGPNYSTTLVVQRIYEEAFKHYNMGYACAMTVALFVIIFIVTMIQLKFTSSLADNGFGEE
jgi:multiple sugar transport system permease protein